MGVSYGEPFRGFRDHGESPFYCAAGRTPEETWEISVNRLAEVLASLGALAAAGPIEMSNELLCSWHREIFGSLFPEDAGRLRWRRAGEWEHVQFGGLIGTERSRRVRGYRGANPRELSRRLQKICDEFNATAAELRSTGGESYPAVHAAARLYAKILRAHPWIDGNLRAAIVALDAALLTLGLPRVEFKDLELHDRLLGVAFVGKHDPYRPLAEHILQMIREMDTGGSTPYP